MTTVCAEAAEFLENEEISSPEYYAQALQHPIWPRGASGITIGIGYDLGYVSEDQFSSDFGDRISSDDLALLRGVCGLRGQAAAERLGGVRSATIPLSAARAVFETISLPLYADETARALPGSDALPPLCFGALVSLVYNRGTAMQDGSADDRRREMREIRIAIEEGRPQDVPAAIRSMKRLWSNGLVGRREREAALFERGLAG